MAKTILNVGLVVSPAVAPLTTYYRDNSVERIYADYAARVTADGGTVANPAATKAAMQWLKDRRILQGAICVSPSYGLKVSGSNIVKLYGFDGTDFTPGGNAPFVLDTSGAYPVANIVSEGDFMQTTVGAYFSGLECALIYVSQIPTVAGARLTCASFDDPSGTEAHMSVDAEMPSSTFYWRAKATKNNLSTNAIDGTTLQTSGSAVASSRYALWNHLSHRSQIMRVGRDGVISPTPRGHEGKNYRPLAGVQGRILMGAWRTAGAFRYGGGTGCCVAAMWWLPGATRQNAIDAGAYLGALY